MLCTNTLATGVFIMSIKLNVKATMIYNFGKFDYVYKPLCPKGEAMLKLVIAKSNKQDSKRQNLSKADCKKAIELASSLNKQIEFIITEVNQPEVPSKPELGSAIEFNCAMPKASATDLGFLD